MTSPKIAKQPALKRIKNFQEVSQGLSKKQGMTEARRCPQCANPECVKGCPLNIDIPGFIRCVREGDFARALQRIREQNSLPGFCGRLCPAPCETACILNKENDPQPIRIKALERLAFDCGQSKTQQLFNAQSSNRTDKKVAVVGCGASGLMVAAQLIEDGHQVTIFEVFEKPGGFLRYGIPEFRFPRKSLEEEIQYVLSLGVELKPLCVIGQTYGIKELFSMGYHAVVLTVGSGIRVYSEFKGQDLLGVYPAQEFLMRVNFDHNAFSAKSSGSFSLGHNVVVIGHDETALDCARVLVRLGKSVSVLHPLTEEEMSAPAEQIQEAIEEGVRLEPLTKPFECVGDDHHRVQGVRCLRLDFMDVGEKGNWKVVPVKDSEFVLKTDSVILCSETKANTMIARLTPGLKIDRHGNFTRKNNEAATSIASVFAAGAAALGEQSLIRVLLDSKCVASSVDLYLRQKETA